MTPAAWDAGLAEPAPLLQSWGYGEVQTYEGWEVERLELAAGLRVSVQLQGRGKLRRAYVPRAPVPATAEAVDALVAWADEHGLARLRLEPEAPSDFASCLRERGFVPAAALHPEHTLIVPLGPPEEMLASFKPKHRYNIRLAERRGVVVEEGADASELERQHAVTAERQGIKAAARHHYELRLEHLEWCRTYVARHDGEAIAAIMVARFRGRAYYLFGGSSRSKRELMPTYAVQWAAMQAAHAAGCRDYDLWGVPPTPDPSHPWFGLWQFKSGFGGELRDYCGAWDLVRSAAAAGAGEAAARLRRGVLKLVNIR